MDTLKQALAFISVREECKTIKKELEQNAQKMGSTTTDNLAYKSVLKQIQALIFKNTIISQAGNKLTQLSYLEQAAMLLNDKHIKLEPINLAFGELESTIAQIDITTMEISGDQSLLATQALANVLKTYLPLKPDDKVVATKLSALEDKIHTYQEKHRASMKP